MGYLASISAVRSVSSFTMVSANLVPLLILKLMRFCIKTSLRFFKSARILASGKVWVSLITWSCSRVTSLIEAAYSRQFRCADDFIAPPKCAYLLNELVTVLCDPSLLESLALSDLRRRSTNDFLLPRSAQCLSLHPYVALTHS
jgi:hypothetical protein